MPTFDGGHYFLTALVPIRTDDVDDGLAVTSPVHALRKRLDMLPTAAATPIHRVGQCPFTRNTLNHFARLVIIDDVAYNGREPGNKLSSLFANLTVAQVAGSASTTWLVVARSKTDGTIARPNHKICVARAGRGPTAGIFALAGWLTPRRARRAMVYAHIAHSTAKAAKLRGSLANQRARNWRNTSAL